MGTAEVGKLSVTLNGTIFGPKRGKKYIIMLHPASNCQQTKTLHTEPAGQLRPFPPPTKK